MLLSAGEKGHRFMLPHATGADHYWQLHLLLCFLHTASGTVLTAICCVMRAAMLQQPRLPPTGQRQAIEVHIKWREVLAQKQNLLNILSKTTGHSVEKLDAVRLVCVLYCSCSHQIVHGGH